MIAKGTKDFSPVCLAWFGKSAVLVIAVRHGRLPMPCPIIIDESVADVRVRIKPAGW